MPRYRIDASRSRVLIDATSSVHPIHSEAQGLEGWVELDVEGGSIGTDGAPAAHLEFPVAELHSGNPLEDRELARRIDARRFPTITGELRSIRPGADPSTFRAAGDITFKGVTKRCEDDLTISVDGDDSIRVHGSSVFDIRDFGMEPPRILMLRVHPEVTVTVDVSALKEG